MYYVNAGSTYALGIMFPVLCTVATMLRFMARRSKNVFIGADDYTSVAALVFTIGCGVILIIGAATETIGWHTPTATAEETFVTISNRITLNAQLEYAFFALSVLAIGFIRLVFVLLYRRIFRGNLFHAINWTIIGVIIAWTIAFFLACLFQCAPHFSAFWTSEEQFAKYCPANFKLNAAMAVIDVALDLAILLLPLGPIWQLNMSARRKLLVCVVFALGIFSVAASCTRMVLLLEVLTYDYGSADPLFGLPGTADPIGVISTGIWWTYMEIGVGCLVCNLPAVVGLLRGKGKNPLGSFLAQISLNSLRSNRSNRSNQQNNHNKSGMTAAGGAGLTANTASSRFGSLPGEESQVAKGDFGLHLHPSPGTREWYDDVPLQSRVSTTTAATTTRLSESGTTIDGEGKRGVSVDE